jgi:hypothetical protein
VQQNRLQNIVDVLVKKSVNECHLFCRTYDSVPEFGANMAQETLGKFFSGVPQKRKSDGDSKKIYEHKRKRGFINNDRS